VPCPNDRNVAIGIVRASVIRTIALQKCDRAPPAAGVIAGVAKHSPGHVGSHNPLVAERKARSESKSRRRGGTRGACGSDADHEDPLLAGVPAQLRRRKCFGAVACRQQTCGGCWRGRPRPARLRCSGASSRPLA
jgi:hypothetical protein